MTEAVYFDLDDTLYSYQQYARHGLRNAADYLESETGKQLHDELFSIYFHEEVTGGTFDALIARHELDPALVEDLVEAFHSASAPLTPYPSTEETLSRLETEYALGLITDGRGGEAKLDRLGIAEYFDTVLVTPTIGSSKAERSVFERALSSLSVSPADAWYVGDDPRVDFPHPNELGMGTVRVCRGRFSDLDPVGAGADHRITTLVELPSLLERRAPRQR